ncbi:MAG: hypothetical protein KBB01_00495 [Candidatus Omnitrophica bacterium]|jgi:hypothetical protein|nr:hypothetical protein [Candidatus Omnitrophota bacterium]
MRESGLTYRKAQYTLEYALIIVVTVAALLTMQAYLKRGIQGGVKQNIDQLGEEYSYNNTLLRGVAKNSSMAIAEYYDKDKYSADIGATTHSEIMMIGDLSGE